MTTSLLTFTADDVPGLSSAAPSPAGDASPESFVQQYLPLAEKVGAEVGVAPSVLLGQWGLETGWGKSVIPGTNNLGNIKDFSRKGPVAVDNMTKSSDSYMQFASPDEFGSHFSGLLGRRYKSAVQSGEDAQRYFTELKRGGYAEDPAYIQKGVQAANLAARLSGGAEKPLQTVRGPAATSNAGSDYYTRDTTKYAGLPEPVPERSYFEAAADVALGTASGVAAGVGMLASAAGADNPVARGAADVARGLEGAQSPQRKAQRAGRADLIRTAEDSGSTLEEIAANLGALKDAPLETVMNAVGTTAPTLLTAFIPGLGQATAARLVLQGAVGATQGAGAVKGSIYESVAAKLIETGVSEMDAFKTAAAAQAYDGANGNQIAYGAILGVLASTTGAETVARALASKAGPGARGRIANAAVTGAAEALTEMPQGAQERVAGNIALQNEGFDVPTMQGVAGQAALEGATGGVVGAGFGALRPGEAAAPAIPAGLEPVAAKAAEANSPLSKAAIAGNTGPAADAARAAQVQASQPVDSAARLAELEAISKGTGDTKNADGQTVPGTPSRFFTTEEQAEYQDLKSRKDSTAAAAGADPLSEKAARISDTIRQQGALDALRAENSPVDVKKVLNDLAIAQSPSTTPAAREQAIGRLEFALEWAGINPAGAASPAIQQIVGTTTEPRKPGPAPDLATNRARVEGTTAEAAQVGPQPQPAPYDTTAAAQERAQADQALQASNEQAASKTAPTPPIDSVIAALKVAKPLRSAEQTALLRQAQTRFSANEQRLLGLAANYPAGMSATDKIQFEQLRGTQNPAKAAAQQAAANTAAIPAESAAQTVSNAGTTVPKTGTILPNSGVNGQDTAQHATVAAAPAATPAGDGPAVFRKRRATLRQIIDMGLTRVEKRGGGFVLTNGKRDFKLDGPADAQLARKEINAAIREGAEQANVDLSAAQALAGNGKKGRVEFDGLKLGIENYIGSERVDKLNTPPQWRTRMELAHYGDVTGTTGADGDGVDIYLVDNPRAGSPVYVIDQYSLDGKFDESKSILGQPDKAAAIRIYDAGFSDGSGPKRRRGVTAMTVEEFKAWAFSPAAKKPAGDADGKTGPAATGSADARGDNGLPDLAAGVADRGPGDARADDRGGNKPARAPAARRGKNAAAADAGAAADHVTVQVDGKTVSLETVDPKSLEQDSPRRDGRPGRQISKANAELISRLATMLGKKVVFFRDPLGDIGDGFVKAGDDTTLFINEIGTIQPLAVMGHEFWHMVKRELPQVHAAISKVVKAHKKADEAKAEYGAKLGYADGEILEEMVSDLGGDLMTDAAFWNEVFDQVAIDHPENSKGLIAALADIFNKMIERLMKGLKGQPDFGADRFVDDMEAIRAAFKQGLAQYIAANGITRTAMQAEILKAGQKIKRSPARAEQALQSTGLEIVSKDDWHVDGDIMSRPVRVRDSGKELDLTAWYAAIPETDGRYVLQLEDEDGRDFHLDDVKRSAQRVPDTNADGQPIHPTAKGQVNFWRWFGGSKVVDEQGRPLVVYHGTQRDFSTFDRMVSVNELGRRIGPDSIGSWFSSNPSKDGGAGMYGDTLMPVYLAVKNPVEWTYAELMDAIEDKLPKGAKRKPGPEEVELLRDELKHYRYDGIKIVHDPKSPSTEFLNQDAWIALEAEQIKSATGNNGQFDSDSADIARSAPRATENPDNSADDRAPAADQNDPARGLGREPARAAGEVPEYGRARPGAVSVLARHYSTSARKELSSAAYGRGYKGGERERVMDADDKRLRDRIHFYVDQGKGIRPESGVGGQAHEVRLNNIYDPRTKLVKSTGGDNAFESAVLDAGFDGYLNAEFTTTNGAVVLLGQHNVPVKHIGTPASAEAPAQAEPETLKKGLMSAELKAVDVSKIPGATLRAGTLTVPEDARAAANDEMERIGSTVRFRTREDESLSALQSAISREDLDRALAGVRRAIPGVEIEVFENPEAAGISGPPGGESPMGVTLRDGRILLFRQGLADRLDAQRTAFHELFHKGLANSLERAEYDRTMDALYEADEEVQRRAHAWGRTAEAKARQDGGMSNRALRSLAIEEALAEMAEDLTTQSPTFVRALGDWVADVATKLGLSDLAEWLRAANLTETQRFIESMLKAAPGQKTTTGDRFSARREALRPEVVAAAGPAIRFLTPTERAKLRVDTATKLADLFKHMPSANEMAAVAYAGKAKRGWYHNSAQALMHVFGPDAPRFAALLAALSPQTSVEVNLRNALQTWKNWTRAGRPQQKGEIFEIMGRSVEGNRLTDSVLPAWVPNTVRALTAEDPEAIVLSGPKVSSFMLNLRGVTEEVTNDAWMANYAAVDQTIFSGSLNVAGTDPGKGPGYMAMSARVRQAARRLTDLTGEDWTPAEVQETVWSWAKTLYELQSKDLGARELLDNEAVTDELIASTPDFRTQLHEERNEDALNEAGYADQLDSLRERGDYARPGDQGSAAGSQAAPFDPDTQGKLERKAAGRLEQLRDNRAAAEAVTRAAGPHDPRSSESHPPAEDVKRSAARPGRDANGNLGGLPTKVSIAGLGEIEAGHWATAEEAARAYTQHAGIDYNPPSEYVKVDTARAQRIAQAYEAMPHDPQNAEVKAAYDALVKEVAAQYRALQVTGLKVEFIDFERQGDPYAASPRLMTEDVRKNNHMWVFSTRDGFGSSELDVADNPLLKETSWEISGEKALVNDLFRVVHDYFGHVKEGVGFRADGEENAWRAHSAMFSPLARKALTTETRGQNSFVNFGPNGEKNRKANAGDTVYADQKTGLLPDWVVEEGATDVKSSKSRDEGDSDYYIEQIPDRNGKLENPWAVRRTEDDGLIDTFGSEESAQDYIDGLDGSSADITRSTARPTFYSQLEVAIESVPDRLQTMSAPQWKLWLDANAGKLGVKKDELEWSGVGDYLKLRGKDKVTRDELAQYVRENGVQVKDVVLADSTRKEFDTIKDAKEFLMELHSQDLDELHEDYGFTNEEDYIGAANQAFENMYPDSAINKSTKFGQYTLPGGSNYREVLITLPDRGAIKYTRANIEALPIDDPAVTNPDLFWYFKTPDNVFQIPKSKHADQVDAREYIIREKQPAAPAGLNYKSSHWDQTNVVAHLRVDDRTDAEGKNVLFINEIQSDWGAAARKNGVAEAAPAKVDKLPDGWVWNKSSGQVNLLMPDGGFAAARTAQSWDTDADLEAKALELYNDLQQRHAIDGKAPNGPFITDTKSWVALALKRAIMIAVESGQDKVAWVTGEQAADFFDLSKQIKYVQWNPNYENGRLITLEDIGGKEIGMSVDPDGTVYDSSLDGAEGKKLEDVLGKELTEKIMAEPNGDLSGLALKLGGSGMRQFYDKIVPQVANDVLKKIGGGKVGEVDFTRPMPAEYYFDSMYPGYSIRTHEGALEVDGTFGGNAAVFASKHDALIALRDATGKSTQPGFDITPSMREKLKAGAPLFSRARDIRDMNVGDGYKVSDFLESSKKVSWWDKTVGTPYHMAERHPTFKRVYDAVQRFIGDVSKYATRAADLAPNILPKLEHMKDIFKSPLSAEDVKALAGPIFQGTLSYTRDGNDQPVKTSDVGLAGIVWHDDELKSIWNLDDRQIKLYREFRRATNKSIADMGITHMLRYAGEDGLSVREAVLKAPTAKIASEILANELGRLAGMDPARANSLMNTARGVKDIADMVGGLIAKGYAPLSRFGDFTVYVTRDNGKEQVFFGMYETQREANKAARAFREDPQFKGADVKTGTMSKEAHKLFKGITPETLALFGEAMGLEQSASDQQSQVFQEYLKIAKANRSAMKHMIERKGIAGYSEDAGRVLAAFVYSNARQASTNLNAGEILKSANDVAEGDLKDQAIKLAEYAQNPQEEAQAIRGMLFGQYIGGSIASALVNTTQSITTTWPALSMHFGIGKAARAMSAALPIVKNGAGTDADLAAAMKRAEEEGVTAPQETHQLMAQAQGRGSLQSGDGTKLGDALAKMGNSFAKVQMIWGKAFGFAEILNRKIAFVSAFQLAREKGIADPYAFAKKIVADTQYTMNKGNNPTWARGPVGATLFTFRKFMIQYLEGLARMWGSGPDGKKAFALSLAIMFMLAGAGGFPFSDDLDDILDGFMQRVLNKSFSSKQVKKEFFAKILGDAGAEFVLTGISGLPGMPVDFSGRLGLGNIAPGSGLLTKKQDHTRDVYEIAGAAGDFAKRMLTAGAAVAQGDFGQAIESAVPIAISNAMKAKSMMELGYYKDLKGRKVIDTTLSEAILKGIGFQPQSVKQLQDAAGVQQSLIGQNKIREAEIADLWAKGRIEHKPELIEDARRQLKEWNDSNPAARIDIDANQINKRVKQANMSKAQRLAATAPKEIRGSVKRELEKATEE